MTEQRSNKLAEQLAKVSRATTAPAPPDPVVVPTTSEADGDRPELRRRPRTAGGRKPVAGESWDDRVKRATFYVDRDLLDELDACCDKHGLNKSEFVREAIIRHLQTYR